MAGGFGHDYQRMLSLAVAALESDQDPWPLVCGELIDVLGVELTGRFDLRWPDGTMQAVTAWPAWAEHMPWTPADVTAHPLVRHHAVRHDREPRTSDEVPDELRWRCSPAYEAARELFGGAVQHLLIPLQGAVGRVRYVGGARGGRQFSDRERDYLRRIQPLLRGADAHHRTLCRLRQATPLHGAANGPAAAEAGLTAREEVVLCLVAEGLTARAIAHRLGISPHTVIKHQQNLYRKLGTNDRLSTVLTAQRIGLLPP
ncbi:helix-turn-helix transcriptional regulator [Micromonospora chersina]|uniref:helix-turn-helix transcriptional regulator n=1 Tax=Micromonospora chersina TaxID=47854 RepID=UPI0033AE5AA4